MIAMNVTVDKAELLAVLRKNLEEHKKMFDEARAGYIEAAIKRLDAKLGKLKAGHITSLHFDLYVPTDHSGDYETIIGMLEMSQDDTIALSFEQYRMYVEDDWQWARNWLVSNSGYSMSSRSKAAEKGYL